FTDDGALRGFVRIYLNDDDVTDLERTAALRIATGDRILIVPSIAGGDHPFSSEELTRYARHFALPGIGVEGQARLRAARVLVVGAGGLGSPALLYLAAAGIGTLGIVDCDAVDLTNLQ